MYTPSRAGIRRPGRRRRALVVALQRHLRGPAAAPATLLSLSAGGHSSQPGHFRTLQVSTRTRSDVARFCPTAYTHLSVLLVRSPGRITLVAVCQRPISPAFCLATGGGSASGPVQPRLDACSWPPERKRSSPPLLTAGVRSWTTAERSGGNLLATPDQATRGIALPALGAPLHSLVVSPSPLFALYLCLQEVRPIPCCCLPVCDVLFHCAWLFPTSSLPTLGTLVRAGIPKPSYRAFQLLHWSGTQLVETRPDFWAHPTVGVFAGLLGMGLCKRSASRLSTQSRCSYLCCLRVLRVFTGAGGGAVSGNGTFVFMANWQVKRSAEIQTEGLHITVGGVAAARASARLYRIDGDHATAFSLWVGTHLRHTAPHSPSNCSVPTSFQQELLSPSTRTPPPCDPFARSCFLTSRPSTRLPPTGMPALPPQVRMGSPTYLTASQVAQLTAASELTPEPLSLRVAAADAVSFDAVLPPNALAVAIINA